MLIYYNFHQSDKTAISSLQVPTLAQEEHTNRYSEELLKGPQIQDNHSLQMSYNHP